MFFPVMVVVSMLWIGGNGQRFHLVDYGKRGVAENYVHTLSWYASSRGGKTGAGTIREKVVFKIKDGLRISLSWDCRHIPMDDTLYRRFGVSDLVVWIGNSSCGYGGSGGLRRGGILAGIGIEMIGVEAETKKGAGLLLKVNRLRRKSHFFLMFKEWECCEG